MAPAMVSRPPRITTGMTLSPKKAMAPSTPPRTPPSSTPPMAETTAAMDQASAKMRFTEMPIERATCCEKAVARMATPARVNLKKSVKMTSRTATLRQAVEVALRDRQRADAAPASAGKISGKGRSVGAPDPLHDGLEDRGEPQRHHDDRDDRLADHGAQQQPLHERCRAAPRRPG